MVVGVVRVVMMWSGMMELGWPSYTPMLSLREGNLGNYNVAMVVVTGSVY